MAWYHQAISHFQSQCWSRSLSPYDLTRLQWVNSCLRLPDRIKNMPWYLEEHVIHNVELCLMTNLIRFAEQLLCMMLPVMVANFCWQQFYVNKIPFPIQTSSKADHELMSLKCNENIVGKWSFQSKRQNAIFLHWGEMEVDMMNNISINLGLTGMLHMQLPECTSYYVCWQL